MFHWVDELLECEVDSFMGEDDDEFSGSFDDGEESFIECED